MILSDESWAALILLEAQRGIYPEGSFLKILDPGESESYKAYLDRAITCDKRKREKRIEVTKRIQEQNKQLLEAQEIIRKNTESIEEALEESRKQKQEAEELRHKAESAYEKAKQELDYAEKKNQFALMGRIVQVALAVILLVGFTTTAMYGFAIFVTQPSESNVTLLANTWSNMFGILLTNSFSIIGTIMGVKYATERTN